MRARTAVDLPAPPPRGRHLDPLLRLDALPRRLPILLSILSLDGLPGMLLGSAAGRHLRVLRDAAHGRRMPLGILGPCPCWLASTSSSYFRDLYEQSPGSLRAPPHRRGYCLYFEGGPRRPAFSPRPRRRVFAAPLVLLRRRPRDSPPALVAFSASLVAVVEGVCDSDCTSGSACPNLCTSRGMAWAWSRRPRSCPSFGSVRAAPFLLPPCTSCCWRPSVWPDTDRRGVAEGVGAAGAGWCNALAPRQPPSGLLPDWLIA